jgi:hypothetical protein
MTNLSQRVWCLHEHLNWELSEKKNTNISTLPNLIGSVKYLGTCLCHLYFEDVISQCGTNYLLFGADDQNTFHVLCVMAQKNLWKI